MTPNCLFYNTLQEIKIVLIGHYCYRILKFIEQKIKTE